jgi:hypothetical protein
LAGLRSSQGGLQSRPSGNCGLRAWQSLTSSRR